MRRLFRFAAVTLIAVLLAGTATPGHAQQGGRERIVSFDADITVNPDGALSIVETIDVFARGNKIKRGIFRDFPTRSITSLGLNHISGFRVDRILRDGKPEPYFSSELAAGVRTYIGRKNIRLRPGRYRYTIAYKTTRQLLFRDTEDELYWNVTGDAWDFPIEVATVTVHLPGGMALKDIAGFTGKPGTTGKDFIVLEKQGSTLRMGTTRTLRPGEGFTIAAIWPAGAVQRPSTGANLMALLHDNRGPFIGLILLAVLLGYYIMVWRRVGKDPEAGVIIPRFEAPDDLSPIAVGFIRNQGFSGEFGPGRAFTVGLTSLATKHAITISEKGSREITITKGDGRTGDLPAGERAVFDTLFADDENDITFGRKYEPGIADARSALMGAFDKEYARLYATKNRRHWLIGAVIALAAIFAALMADASGDGSLAVTVFMLIFAAGFSVPGLFLLTRSFPHFRTAIRSRKIGSMLAGLLVMGLSLGFLAPVFGVAFMMLTVVTPAALVIAALPIIITFCFWFWLTAPTQLGREVLDGIAGYRLYLSVAEADRLNAAGREPEITEALFEKHLPYAMALRVEDEWTEKFEAKLEASAQDSTTSRSSYRPGWYHSNSSRWRGPSTLTRSLTRSLGGAASTASTKPSSSSGGTSSSGSSGGGGGGGGGGGW
jgi:uncharacterized membrane protein YgcG